MDARGQVYMDLFGDAPAEDKERMARELEQARRVHEKRIYAEASQRPIRPHKKGDPTLRPFRKN